MDVSNGPVVERLPDVGPTTETELEASSTAVSFHVLLLVLFSTLVDASADWLEREPVSFEAGLVDFSLTDEPLGRRFFNPSIHCNQNQSQSRTFYHERSNLPRLTLFN
jgi:hypothetical protein